MRSSRSECRTTYPYHPAMDSGVARRGAEVEVAYLLAKCPARCAAAFLKQAIKGSVSDPAGL